MGWQSLVSGGSALMEVAPSRGGVRGGRRYNRSLAGSGRSASLRVILNADPKFLDTLRPFCEMAAKERSATAGTLCSAVEREVETLLPHGKATARTVARNLALSVRTQSRRLADEGTTYAEVVDHLRRSLALQYLKEPGISVSQIAWLLGYEGSTSFNHAFRRWTGQSPSTARNQKLVAVALT